MKYKAINNYTTMSIVGDNIKKALENLWKPNVPSKIHMFGWMLLLGRLPTRVNLENRSVLHGSLNTCCVYYFQLNETVNHVFYECYFTKFWLGIGEVHGSLGVDHFLCFRELVKRRYHKN